MLTAGAALVGSLWIALAHVARANPASPLAPLERGRLLYLLNCSRCHGEDATGGGPDGVVFETPPASLRGAARLGDGTDEDLVTSILHDQPRLRPSLDMPERTPQTDALYDYLRRLPGIPWEAADAGRAIFSGRCSGCHGPYGRVESPRPAGSAREPRDLSSPEFQGAVSDSALRALVRHGRPGMPSQYPATSEPESARLASFVRLLSPGYELYWRYCVSCHGPHGQAERGDREHPRRVAFDAAYFRQHPAGEVRSKIWHMMRGVRPAMPHFEGRVAPADVRAILDYLRSLPPEPAAPAPRGLP